MKPSKIVLPMLFLIGIVISLWGCSSAPALVKTSGSGFAQSEYHKLSREVKEVVHYRPMAFQEMKPLLPEALAERFHTIDKSKLPFSVDREEANLVAFAYDSGQEPYHQLQLLYKQDEDDNNFFVIRMTQTEENPLPPLAPSLESLDTFGNIAKVEQLREDVPMIHHIIQTNSSYTYSYYDYNEENRVAHLVTTAANEIDFYDDGILYQIGYHINGNKPDENVQKQMVALAKELAGRS
ncbi:hypothetical protein [uncultured Brevibacillus sp.]|uniref:hypothetical protein n=1 Tax=uncultured Brevibacillus sp. TaxID=169970 RepID=UPI0025933E31|nr:hypothetical protein [uncultured Brevibacillus sp.]